jgi:hypothetical protein
LQTKISLEKTTLAEVKDKYHILIGKHKELFDKLGLMGPEIFKEIMEKEGLIEDH